MGVLSSRISLIEPSGTLKINALANKLKQEGRNIISLAAGELDFDIEPHIKEAVITAIRSGKYNKYTNADGMLELKEAVKEKLLQENNLRYDLDEIIISNGGKQVIYNFFMALLNVGDEVIVPTPYWVSYSESIKLAGGIPVFLKSNAESNFKFTADSFKKHITSKTKCIIINSPNNPTGAVYTKEELVLISKVIDKYPNIHVLSDDIYEHIVFDDIRFNNILSVAPHLKNRVFIVNGISKAYSMTGWRIGYGAGNKEIINAMTTIQSHSANPASISQVGAIAALRGSQKHIVKNTLALQNRRNIVFDIISSVDHLKCHKPSGAFYLLIDNSMLIGYKTKRGFVIRNDDDFVEYIIEDANVAVVPGSAFGLSGHFRISYAIGESDLIEACNNIKLSCSKLSRI